MTADQIPTVLTVDEAASILRISRGTAYSLARRWLAGDPDGLQVVRVGRSLRVPGHVIREALADLGERDDRRSEVKRIVIHTRTHRRPRRRRQRAARS
jgi:hypothetical protein